MTNKFLISILFLFLLLLVVAVVFCFIWVSLVVFLLLLLLLAIRINFIFQCMHLHIVRNRRQSSKHFSSHLSPFSFSFLSSSFSIRSRVRSINFSRLCFEMYTLTHSYKMDADGFFSFLTWIDRGLPLTHSLARYSNERVKKYEKSNNTTKKNKLTWKILLRFIYWASECVCLCFIEMHAWCG